MKKFLTVLLIGCCLLSGCGDKVETPTVESENETESTVSQAAISAEEEESVPEDDTETDSAVIENDPILSHTISVHENAEPEEGVEYFPCMQTIASVEDSLYTATFYKDDYLKYDYSFEHRVFDFMTAATAESLESDESKLYLTMTNMLAVSDKIKSEYMTEEGLNDTNSVVLKEDFDRNSGFMHLYITKCDPKDLELPEFESEEEMDAYFDNYVNPIKNVTCFIMFHSLDDPSNGVTVMRINDMDPYETPMV